MNWASIIMAGLDAGKGWEDVYVELRPPISKPEFRRHFLNIARDRP